MHLDMAVANVTFPAMNCNADGIVVGDVEQPRVTGIGLRAQLSSHAQIAWCL